MSRHEKTVEDLLTSAGATLVRTKKHQVYRLPDGRAFVRSSSGSDWRTERNSLRDLKRLLNEDHREPDTASMAIEATPRAEGTVGLLVRPSPPREEAELVIPRIIPGHQRSRANCEVEFRSIDEVLEAAYRCASFWELDAGGRCRVLAKFISRFSRVEPVATRFCKMKPGEWGSLLTDAAAGNLEAVTRFLVELGVRWKRSFSTGLLVHDNRESGGKILIEPLAIHRFSGAEALIVCPAAEQDMRYPVVFGTWGFGESCGNRHRPADSERIFCLWVPPEEMRRSVIRPGFCGCWTNPSRTRHVVRDVIDRHQR